MFEEVILLSFFGKRGSSIELPHFWLGWSKRGGGVGGSWWTLSSVHTFDFAVESFSSYFFFLPILILYFYSIF